MQNFKRSGKIEKAIHCRIGESVVPFAGEVPLRDQFSEAINEIEQLDTLFSRIRQRIVQME